MKWSDLNPKLKQRLINENPETLDSHGIIMAGLDNPKSKQREVQALASSASSQTGSAKSLDKWVVTIVSYRSRLIDDDNLTGGAKALRDSIAKTLGIDDGHPGIAWKYIQVVSPIRGTHVLVTQYVDCSQKSE